jgi:hypothetical protein
VGEPSHIPKTGTPENKVRNYGAFFEAKKLTAKTPHFTTQPPRLHHQKTTIKHPFFAKTPAKHHKPHPEKNTRLPTTNSTVPTYRLGTNSARFARTMKNAVPWSGNKTQGTMPLSPRDLLEKELESVVRDIQTIEDQIANDPPDTSGELLRLREIQRTYRGIAVSIKQAIALEDSHFIAWVAIRGPQRKPPQNLQNIKPCNLS